MRRGRLGASLTPGGYVLGVGDYGNYQPAPFTTPGGVVQVQPGIGDTPATIAPSVTGYGQQPGSTAAPGGMFANLTTFEEILIVLGVIGAIVLLPDLMKK